MSVDVLAVCTCLRCGADLDVVTVGRVVCGREGSVVLACSECRHEHHLRVTLSPLYEQLDTSAPHSTRPAVCGTDSGYYKHRRLGEQACGACTAAHTDANTRRVARQKVTA